MLAPSLHTYYITLSIGTTNSTVLQFACGSVRRKSDSSAFLSAIYQNLWDIKPVKCCSSEVMFVLLYDLRGLTHTDCSAVHCHADECQSLFICLMLTATVLTATKKKQLPVIFNWLSLKSFAL